MCVDDFDVLHKFERSESWNRDYAPFSILLLKGTTPSTRVNSLRLTPLSQPLALSVKNKVWQHKNIIIITLAVLQMKMLVMICPLLVREQAQPVTCPAALMA